MERLLYNCEKLELFYDDPIKDDTMEVVYQKYTKPEDSNTYFNIITEGKKRAPGSLLHVFINNEDKGLFIVDTNNHLVSITNGEHFYKPLYKAYDELLNNINNDI